MVGDESANIDLIDGENVTYISELNASFFEGKFVIICEYDKKDAKAVLEKFGLKEGEDYVEADAIFSCLDVDWHRYRSNRQLAFWGCGDECLYLEKHTQEAPDIYIDKSKSGVRNGKNIVQPEDIKNWHNYYIVVTSLKYYMEIKKQLEGYGLQEEIDFIIYRKLLTEDFPEGWNKMLPSEMMRKTVYAPSKDIPICMRPFEYVQIGAGGNFFCCCPAWLELPLGSLNTDNMDQIWYGITAKLFRLSMINRTFCFCRQNECAFLKKHCNKKNTEQIESKHEDEYTLKVTHPKSLLISIDPRCNLKCPQCRKDFYKLDEAEERLLNLQYERIRDCGWMQNTNLAMAGYGEVFFSPIYRQILYDTATRRPSIGLISNGLLITEEEIQHLLEIYDHIGINISIDAATSETYKKIRGGNFELLLSNIRNIVRHRANGEIARITLSYVTQRSNFKEIPQAIALAHDLGVDKIEFQKIHNPGYMDESEFINNDAISDDSDNPIEELRSILAHVDVNDPRVDLFQLINYIS